MRKLKMKHAKLGNDVVVFQANNILDVFFGKLGWDLHARFHLTNTKNGKFLKQVTKHHIPRQVFQSIKEKVGV